ncbi:MAG: hypothetical protein FWC91_06415 [Defluviitaleaceae bacterium]|nr:hypothetical protein [Defluviitaleaceae bacterium]
MNATAKKLWVHRGKLFFISLFAMFTAFLTACNERERAEIRAELEAAARQAVEDVISDVADNVINEVEDAVANVENTARDTLSNWADAINQALTNRRSEPEIIEFTLDRYRRIVENTGDYAMAAYVLMSGSSIAMEFPFQLRESIRLITKFEVTGGITGVSELASVGRAIGNTAKYFSIAKYLLEFLLLEISITEMYYHMLHQRENYINVSPEIIANIDRIIIYIEEIQNRSHRAQRFYAKDLTMIYGLTKYGGPVGWVAVSAATIFGMPSRHSIRNAFDAYDDVSKIVRNREYLVN